MRDTICAAIQNHELLEFEYDGLHRVVQPYCHGTTANGEALRAVQVAGQSRSRRMGSGKLWMLEKMLDVRRSAQRFVPDDPDYNPNDSAMKSIHCNVQRRHPA